MHIYIYIYICMHVKIWSDSIFLNHGPFSGTLNKRGGLLMRTAKATIITHMYIYIYVYLYIKLYYFILYHIILDCVILY